MFFQHYEQIGRFVFYETLPLACQISSDTRLNIKKSIRGFCIANEMKVPRMITLKKVRVVTYTFEWK